MKKTLKYIFVASIMMFVGIGTSFAANPKLKCEYSLKLDNLGLGYVKGTKKITMSVYSSKATSSISGGDFIGDTGYEQPVAFQSGFLDVYFSEATKNGNYACPIIKLAAFNNGLQLGSLNQDTTDALASIKVSGEKTGGTQQVATRNEICHFNTKEIKTQSAYLTISFLKVGSNKVWSITKKNDSGLNELVGERAYNDSISDGTYTYKISPDDYETYWNASTCDKSHYVQYPGGSVFTIQSAKPSDVENGEVGAQAPTRPDGPTIVTFDGCANMPKTTELLRQVYSLIRYLIPVLIIILSLVDFIKVVSTGDDKDYKTAWNKFIKRIIVGIVILLVPVLVSALINISGIANAEDASSLICILK